MTVSAASTASQRVDDPCCGRQRIGAPSGSRRYSTRHSTAVTASCNAGARSASTAAPVTAMPSGSAAVSCAGTAARGRFRPRTRGRGTRRRSRARSTTRARSSPSVRARNPSVNASGSCVDAKRPLEGPRHVAVPDPRILPRFVYWSRTGQLVPHFTRPPPAGHRCGRANARRLVYGCGRANARRLGAAGLRPRKRTAPRLDRPVLAGALATASRCDRRRHDVLERVVGAYPAVVARRPPAIGEPVLGQRRLPVVPEEVVVQTRRAMWSQGRISSAWRCRVTYQSGSRPSAAHRVDPAVEREVLAPLLERPAVPARRAR